ncbi:MAG: right-handed parallel beta-helix repeat-containing protein [Saprospiraceae bacterium]
MTLLFVSSLFIAGCLEEDVFSAPSENLTFSVDTLRFDTVFTTLGSVTRSVRLINNSNQNISLSSINFESNDFSKFRMNVDGLPGDNFSNIEILAHDSLYIFVEVTIDPDEPLSISPFIISDAIVIEGGNISQKIFLEAWGQNANYIPNQFNAGQGARLSCDNQLLRWDDPKPYVVYGVLFVDSCNLYLPPGTQIYVHGGLANFNGVIANDGIFIFTENASLTSEGTLENPVVFQGDRLEKGFQDAFGQWNGILFSNNSKNNSIKHTIIKNSVIGIRADSAASVKIDNSIIFNTTNVAIIGQHSNIEVTNTLLHSNGSASIALGFGGNYNISYTTLANYGNQNPAVILDNYKVIDQNQNLIDVFPINATFTNCIIAGSTKDEILYDDGTDGSDPNVFNISFINCLVKIEDLESDTFFESICQNCISIAQGDSIFIDRFEFDYHLHPTSPAMNVGIPIVSITDDLESQIRDSSTPDLGCYESQ